MPGARSSNSRDPRLWITEIHPHDVLNGRGVNIAQHPGNLRFRALIKSHADEDYCSEYSAQAKKALAEGIVRHIQNLKPPGRFLRRPPRSKNKAEVEEGIWEELDYKAALKKTSQALRDCNRIDRTGYAEAIAPPVDVQLSEMTRQNSGLTKRQYAERVACGSGPPIEAPSNTNLVNAVARKQLSVDTSLVASVSEHGTQVADTSVAFTPKFSTITPTTVASTAEFDRFPDRDTSESPEDQHLENPDVTLPHPFADTFAHSPSDPVALDYDEHFDMEEEQKLTAIARQSAALDTHFDSSDNADNNESLDRHLGDSADFSNIFDGDLVM